jgi:hypothetical protein
MDSEWETFVWSIGEKHCGKTMFQIYANDYSYIEWALAKLTLPKEEREALLAAKAHKEAVDPYAQDA